MIWKWKKHKKSHCICPNNLSYLYRQPLTTLSKFYQLSLIKGYNLTEIFRIITKIKLDLFVIMIYHSANFEWNQPILHKLLWGNNTYILYFTPTTKTKLKKSGNSAWPKFADNYQHQKPDLYFPMIYDMISFCKLPMKSLHPCKSFWAETNINTTTRTKVKKGLLIPLLGQKFADDNKYLIWPVFYNDISFSNFLMKSMHPFKMYWTETNILTQQKKNKFKKGNNSAWPKFCRWLPISNLT